MKRLASILLAALLLGGLSVSGGALAGDRHHYGGYRGHGVHGSVFIGVPLYAPWGYARPYGYGYPYGAYGGYGPYGPYGGYPQTVITVPSAPPVYIERDASTAPPPATTYWYYCNSVRGYYPYVKECPEGWQRVTPQPPPG